jgi:RNA polymerase sigma-70 factor (ECF subfamily)
MGYDRKVISSADQALRDQLPDVVRVLVKNRLKFLALVRRQVQSRDVAEDILQEAFARGIDRIESLRDEEAILAWFYRVLRNTISDHDRRNTVATRCMETLATEHKHTSTPHDDSECICKCVNHLATKLKPKYAEALQRIEVDGIAVKAFAEEHGLSSGNAGVRVFRAREALRQLVKARCGTCATGGDCRNCTCGATEPAPKGSL